MENQIKNASKRWAEALRTRKPDNVARLYHPDGLLWGTFAGKIHHRPVEIREYFVELMEKENLACRFHEEAKIRLYGEFAFFSGSYEFTWTEAGLPKNKDARFSIVFKKENAEWLIMEHHSSVFPG